MKTFRAHKSFIPESVVMSTSRVTAPIVILAKTDYEIIDTNQAFGVYVKVISPTIVDSNKTVAQKIYITPQEIDIYGEVQNKLTISEISKVLNNISFVKSCIDFHWGWEVTEVEGDCCTECKERNDLENETGYTTNYNKIKGFLINTTFQRPDVLTGIIGTGRGRRMWVEETASETSIVMTAWVCVELIVKHETLESFLYKNAKILNPHKTLSELAYPDIIEK